MNATSHSASWWSRNWRALVVLGILLAATPAVIIGNSVRHRRQINPTQPVAVDAGQSVQYGAASVGPVTATFDTDDDAPPNTRVVRATIELRNASSLLCLDPTLSETTGEHRNFGSTTLLLSGDELSAATSCGSRVEDAGGLSLTYVIPADASGPFVIKFAAPDELPRYLEFTVQP